MKQSKFEKKKVLFLILVFLVYIAIGTMLFFLVKSGSIEKLTPRSNEFEVIEYDLGEEYKYVPERLYAAQNFVNEKLRTENGHINQYYALNSSDESDNYTNSEAISYYLIWTAKSYNKVEFDKQLDYIEEHMIHPQGGYIMWKLDKNDNVLDDGVNIATDADLRAIDALKIAHDIWGDKRYMDLINDLAASLEKVAITEDNYFTPYGGFNGEYWKTTEVWLSYSDFNGFTSLAEIRGNPWRSVYYNMEEAILEAQDENNLYFTQIEEDDSFSSRLDNDKYSINTLWIMVRSAESNSEKLKESSRRALEFYKAKYAQDGMIFTDYNKDATPASGGDSPWVYALVGRAAIALEDEAFSDSMMYELLKKQEINQESELYGAFLEGPVGNQKVGQFTMQELIITLQEYIKMKAKKYNEIQRESGA